MLTHSVELYSYGWISFSIEFFLEKFATRRDNLSKKKLALVDLRREICRGHKEIQSLSFLETAKKFLQLSLTFLNSNQRQTFKQRNSQRFHKFKFLFPKLPPTFTTLLSIFASDQNSEVRKFTAKHFLVSPTFFISVKFNRNTSRLRLKPPPPGRIRTRGPLKHVKMMPRAAFGISERLKPYNLLEQL